MAWHDYLFAICSRNRLARLVQWFLSTPIGLETFCGNLWRRLLRTSIACRYFLDFTLLRFRDMNKVLSKFNVLILAIMSFRSTTFYPFFLNKRNFYFYILNQFHVTVPRNIGSICWTWRYNLIITIHLPEKSWNVMFLWFPIPNSMINAKRITRTIADQNIIDIDNCGLRGFVMWWSHHNLTI